MGLKDKDSRPVKANELKQERLTAISMPGFFKNGIIDVNSVNLAQPLACPCRHRS
jgi:hypothetical protein